MIEKDLIKVENDNSLARDKNSQGIVNTNVAEYQRHLAIKNSRKQKESLVKDEINNLKNEMSEIKILLKELLGRK